MKTIITLALALLIIHCVPFCHCRVGACACALVRLGGRAGLGFVLVCWLHGSSVHGHGAQAGAWLSATQPKAV